VAENSRLENSGNEEGPSALHRTILGVLAGGGLFLVLMLMLAGMAVVSGLITHDEAARPNLGPWLVLEIAGGAVASVLAGVVSRRIARCYRGPGVLAVCLLSLGILEAVELLGQDAAGGAVAPIWLVLLAPIIMTVGVLLGGWRPRKPGRTHRCT